MPVSVSFKPHRRKNHKKLNFPSPKALPNETSIEEWEQEKERLVMPAINNNPDPKPNEGEHKGGSIDPITIQSSRHTG
jgi:hypothetical protein